MTKKPLSSLTVWRTAIGMLSIINCIAFLIVFVPACNGSAEEETTTGTPNWSNDVTCYENGLCCDSTDWCCDENGYSCAQYGCWNLDDVPTDESPGIITETENTDTDDEEESSFPQNLQAGLEDFVSRYVVTCFLPFAAILFFTVAGIFSLLFCRNRKKYSYIVIAVLYGLAFINSKQNTPSIIPAWVGMNASTNQYALIQVKLSIFFAHMFVFHCNQAVFVL